MFVLFANCQWKTDFRGLAEEVEETVEEVVVGFAVDDVKVLLPGSNRTARVSKH